MKTGNKWTEKLVINTFLVDKTLKITLASIANLLQEIAWHHADSLDLGYEGMKRRGLFWVLNRLRIEVVNLPTWQQEVQLTTWPSQMTPFAHRFFSMTDMEGNPLLNASSLWIPLDYEQRRPRRLTDYEVTLEPEHACALPEKLPLTEGVQLSSQRTVQYSDLDMQNHINNTKYIEWITDDLYKNEDDFLIKTLEINYLNEGFKNQNIEIHVLKTENQAHYSLIRSDDKVEICRARVEFIY